MRELLYCCQARVFSTAARRAEDDPNLELVVRDMEEDDSLTMPLLLPVRCSRLVLPDPESCRVLRLVGIGILELLGCLALAEIGVLSTDELLSVRFLSCVDVLRGTLEPNPTGVGRMPRAPFRMLLERRTLEPRRPPSSSELSDMLEPWRLGGRLPGLEPGVRELRPPWLDWRRE